MVSDKLRSLEADAANYLTAEWPMRHTLSGRRQKACRTRIRRPAVAILAWRPNGPDLVGSGRREM
jgi:hypothetical protein